MKVSYMLILIISFYLIGCTTNSNYNKTGITPEITNHRSEETLKLWGYDFDVVLRDKNSLFLDYTGDDDKIELNVINRIDEKDATEIMSDKLTMLNSLYWPKEAAYPGQFTRQIECPDEFKPEYREGIISGQKINYSVYYSNSNYAAGACSEDLAKFSSAYILIYCNSTSRLYEIRYYVPLKSNSKINKFISELTC